MVLKIPLFVVFIYSVQCVPNEIAKVSLINAQNREENLKGDNHDVALNSKATNFNLEDAFNKGLRNDYSQENNAGKYDLVNNNNNHHLDKTNYADQNFNQQEGGAVSNSNKKLAHKNGHHNSGFRNTYHKDESSNKSSYYNDNDEQGGEFAQKSNNGAYGNRKAFDDGGSHLDNSFRLRENQENGIYDNGRNHQKLVGNDNKNYNEGYYTDRENLGKVREGNRHGLASNYYQENLHQHHPQFYYNPSAYDRTLYENRPRNYNHKILLNAYNRPDKQTITIYEDPRVYNHGLDYETYRNPEYRRNNVELNVVPPFKSSRFSSYDSIRPVYEHEYY